MKFTLPIFFILLFFACKNEPKAPPVPEAAGEELPEGFAEFYQRFHIDSAFQMEHITFPLEGLPDQADGETIAKKEFRWTAESWSLMRPVDFQMSGYKREIVAATPSLVFEQISHPESGIGMERRYSIIGGEWHLIYYAGMNRMK